jgi:hypothetical protein
MENVWHVWVLMLTFVVGIIAASMCFEAHVNNKSLGVSPARGFHARDDFRPRPACGEARISIALGSFLAGRAAGTPIYEQIQTF